MRYITNRRMRIKSISGDVNIPYGKSLDLVGDMLYYHGSGVPVISDLAKYFAEQGARYIYTLIMLAGYALIAAIFVVIYQLCYKLSAKGKKSKSKA